MKGRIGYINVGVRDLKRAVEFYRDKLDFQLLFESPEHHYARFDVGGMRFGVAASETDGFTGNPPGHRHTGISITVENVDAAFQELKARGVTFTMEPSKQPWGGYMAMFSDPDGNQYYLDTAE